VDAGRYTTREEKRFQVSGVPDISLTTFDGSMEIRSWDRPEVLVEIEKRAGDKAQADAILVRAEQSGSTVTIDVRKPTGAQVMVGFGTSPSAKVVASVPRHSNVTAHSGDGSIAIERIDGSVDLTTGDGTVRGLDLNGPLRVHTGDGSLRFENVEGTVDLQTGDGGARLSGKLCAVKLRTGDGSVQVQAEPGSAMTDDWDIRTGDGGLRLELPDGFAASLNAVTNDGAVRVVGFGDPASAGRDDDSRRSLTRAIGAGGKLLRLRCESGTILVRKQ
jgi:DUF4097 and DUF4098 domain-containing protein YvlB